MEEQKLIKVLNHLIEANNDRIEAYKSVYEKCKEEYLKSVFCNFIKTSAKCRKQIVSEILLLDGDLYAGISFSYKIYKARMNVKSMLKNNHRESLLSFCEGIENDCIGVYELVLEKYSEGMNTKPQIMIGAQLVLIRIDSEMLKELKETLV